MLLMGANPLRGGKWEGLGPGNRDFFGPCEMASSRKASAIWGRKKSRKGGVGEPGEHTSTHILNTDFIDLI
jgi:hypothetical protein